MEKNGAATVGVGELAEHPDEDWLLVDVRTPLEYREVHIEGSLNAPLADLPAFAEALRKRANDRRVALVCRTGRRAQAAVQALHSSGVDDVRVLEGGITSWVDEGQPVKRGEKAMSLERQVRIVAGSLVVLGVALGALVHPAFLALSGFVGAGLVFAGITDSCGLALVLSKLPWNRARASARCEV